MRDYAKLKELALASTQGDWNHWRHGVIKGGPVVKFANGSSQQQIAMTTGAEWMDLGEKERNADFIAAANPTAVLALLADLESLELDLQIAETGRRLAVDKTMKLEGEVERLSKLPTNWTEVYQQVDDFEALEAECEGLRLDAGRYRWLRDSSESFHAFYISTPIWFTGVKFSKENVDSSIDAAMSKEPADDRGSEG